VPPTAGASRSTRSRYRQFPVVSTNVACSLIAERVWQSTLSLSNGTRANSPPCQQRYPVRDQLHLPLWRLRFLRRTYMKYRSEDADIRQMLDGPAQSPRTLLPARSSGSLDASSRTG